ncbi:unnamed protein product [Oreochromis niloticus]|nr:unnamed protein product [Mustela putorius furo]
MFAVTSPSLCWTLLSISLVGFTCAGHKNITAESGQDVPLMCRAPNNNNRVVKWSRADLEPEYVLLYRDDQFVPDEQHPSFKNRVDLLDRQMKDGDVSLILKNVTIHDAATYECRVVMRGTRSWKSISIIILSVDPPAPPGGDTEDGEVKDGVARGHYGALVASVLLLVVLAVLIFKKYKEDETSSMTVE